MDRLCWIYGCSTVATCLPHGGHMPPLWCDEQNLRIFAPIFQEYNRLCGEQHEQEEDGNGLESRRQKLVSRKFKQALVPTLHCYLKLNRTFAALNQRAQNSESYH